MTLEEKIRNHQQQYRSARKQVELKILDIEKRRDFVSKPEEEISQLRTQADLYGLAEEILARLL